METNLLIVGILTVGFGLASLLSYIMQRFGFPAILGYLLAGFIIGPYSPGYVADITISEQLAEIGVILMLFGVGLHFRLEDLIRVRHIAIPGACGQTAGATLVTALIVYALGWPLTTGVIIGLAIGVASTVVLIRLLTDNQIVNTQKGHIAVGWLVVEDIFTVIILILLPTIAAVSAGMEFSWLKVIGLVLFVLVKFLALALLMFTWGHRLIVYILTNVAKLRSQELFTLTIFALVFLIAMGSLVIFGTSIALGAFIAGMVIGKTSVGHRAAANALPLKDIFAVIFFLSVGMLFNPEAIVSNFVLFIGILFVILVIKPLIAYAITILYGYSFNTALTVAISLAQIGEFSFILAEEAMHLNLLPEEGFDILIACALISIALNPLFFRWIGWLEKKMHLTSSYRGGKDSLWKIAKKKKRSSQKVAIVGFDTMGQKIEKIILDRGLIPVIIENDASKVPDISKSEEIFFGDATEPNIFEEIHLNEAKYLLLTSKDTSKTIQMINAARQVNPEIKIVCTIPYASDLSLFDKLHVNYVCQESETEKAYITLVQRLFNREF